MLEKLVELLLNPDFIRRAKARPSPAAPSGISRAFDYLE